MLKNENNVNIVFMDLAKDSAFVNHRIHCARLSIYGIEIATTD